VLVREQVVHPSPVECQGYGTGSQVGTDLHADAVGIDLIRSDVVDHSRGPGLSVLILSQFSEQGGFGPMPRLYGVGLHCSNFAALAGLPCLTTS